MAQIDTAPYPTQPPPGPTAYHDGTPSTFEQQQQQPPPPQSQHSHQQQQDPPQFNQKTFTNIQPLIDPTSFEDSNTPVVGFSTGLGGYPKPANEYTVDETPSAYTSNSSTSRNINLRYQLFLDKISPHWKARWTFSLLALVVFLARVVISQGWYVICYGLAIYYLNLLIGFISPRVDPSLSVGEDDDDLGPMLPTSANDEFKPFIRRVPEFKFWISGTKATLIALTMTLFSIFDVPVFWPILLIYFIMLFACTMRQQIKHMIRYSYVPWDSGKKKYAASVNNDSSSPTTI